MNFGGVSNKYEKKFIQQFRYSLRVIFLDDLSLPSAVIPFAAHAHCAPSPRKRQTLI